MKVIKFIAEMFRKSPWLVLSNIASAIIVNLLAAVSVCTLTPLIDSFLYPDGHGRSALTMRVTMILKSFGIPTNLMSMVLVFIVLFLLTAIVQTYGNMLILRTRFYLSKDLMIGFFRISSMLNGIFYHQRTRQDI